MVPIEFSIGSDSINPERRKNVGQGGLCFRSHIRLIPGAAIDLVIPLPLTPLKVHGVVAWCRAAGRGFDVGVRFDQDKSAFVMRMAEQICHIEQYRREVFVREGRLLTRDECAAEWITRFAAHFPH